MSSSRVRVINIDPPRRIAYAAQPPLLGGVVEYITPAEFAKRTRITYDESIYLEANIVPHVMERASFAACMSTFYQAELAALIANPTHYLVVGKMGKYGHGLFAAVDLPDDKLIAIYNGTLFDFDKDKTSAVASDEPMAFAQPSVAAFNFRFSLRHGRGVSSFFQHLSDKKIFADIETFQQALEDRDQKNYSLDLLKLNCELYATHFADDKIEPAFQNVQSEPLFFNGYPVIGFRTMYPVKKGEMLGFNYNYEYWLARNKTPALFYPHGGEISPLLYYKSYGAFNLGPYTFKGEFQALIAKACAGDTVTMTSKAGDTYDYSANLVESKLRAARALINIQFTLPRKINIVDENKNVLRSLELSAEQQYYFYQLRKVVGSSVIAKKAFQATYEISTAWLKEIHAYNPENLVLLSAMLNLSNVSAFIFAAESKAPLTTAPKLSG